MIYAIDVDSLLIYLYRMEDRKENGTITTVTMYEGHHELTERQRSLYLYHYDTILTGLHFSQRGALQLRDVSTGTVLGGRSGSEVKCFCQGRRLCLHRRRISFFEGQFRAHVIKAPHTIPEQQKQKKSNTTQYSSDSSLISEESSGEEFEI